jgi:DNA-directed RNA polymerase subunit E'/Rpb7
MTTDPIYERRVLVRSVKLPAKQVQRSIQSSLLAHLKSTVLGKCGTEGYLSSEGNTILEHSMGQIVDGGVLYQVKFQTDICYPHKNQIFKAPAVLLSRIGVKLELGPMRILLPRDIHIENEAFNSIKVGDEVTFTVEGSEFKQDDSVIFIIGSLLNREEGKVAEEAKEVVAETTTEASSTDVKQVVTVPSLAEGPKRRKKVLAARSESLSINPTGVQDAEGKVEGTN